jgi:hypothetical protein
MFKVRGCAFVQGRRATSETLCKLALMNIERNLEPQTSDLKLQTMTLTLNFKLLKNVHRKQEPKISARSTRSDSTAI